MMAEALGKVLFVNRPTPKGIRIGYCGEMIFIYHKVDLLSINFYFSTGITHSNLIIINIFIPHFRNE